MAGQEYQMAFSIGAKLQSQFSGAFKSAQASVTALQNEIQSLNKQQHDITAYQKQQRAIELTKAKLQMLQEQYANLKSSMGDNSEASVDLKNKMLAKELQIERTGQTLEAQTEKLGQMGNALNEAGIDTQNLTSESLSLAYQMEALKSEQEEVIESSDNMGASMSESADAVSEFVSVLGLMAAFKEAAAVMKACTEEAIAFENSMAAVKRTVGGDEAFLSDLGASFKELSTVIPISTAELTEIATTAGQLGVAQGDVEQFTTVMAKLATTTDLTANDAATMLAQFANITGLKDYDRLGSVIAELGDATATTASKVVQMSQGMAASASQAGMTSTDIMAISAALGSLGIEAQAGATSMSQLISTLYKATETGEGLKDFASVAGMSAEQFKQAWATDAVGAMNAFIQGLNDTERNGKSAIVILDELGITNVRQTKAILGLASAGDLLSRTISQASNAWNSNTALTQKAQVMYETTQAKLTMLNNAFNNTKIAIGDAFTPIVSGASTALTEMLKPVTSFIEQNPGLVRAFAAAAAVIGTVTVALTAYAAVAKIAAAASALLTAAIPGMKLIMGVTLAVAGLAAGISLLVDAFSGGHQSMEELNAEFDSMNEQIQEQQEIIDLCERYKQLKKELDAVGKSSDMKLLLDATISKHGFENAEDIKEISKLLTNGDDTVLISVTADVAKGFDLLKPTDFVDGQEIQIKGEADAKELIEATKFLKDGEAFVELDAKAGEQISSMELINDLINNEAVIKLSGKALQTVAAAGFLKSGDDTIQLKALPEQFRSIEFISDAAKNGEIQIALTPGVASTLNQYKLLDGSIVQLSATAQKEIAASDFMRDRQVQIKAEAVKTLYAEGFLKGTDIITFKAQPDQTTKITVDDFIAADQRYVHLTAGIDNLADLQAAVSDLESKAASAKDDFSTAKADLEAMKGRYEELEARLKHAGSKSDKSTIRAEMESLSEEIEKQEGKVTKLETAYTNVSAELMITSAAANDLKAKEAELASVKEQLAAASSGVKGALSGETEELDKQVEATENMAVLQKAALRQKVYDNLTAQADKYAQTVKKSADYAAQMAPTIDLAKNSEKYLGMTADQVNATYQSTLAELNKMQAMEGFDPFDASFLSKIEEANTLAALLGTNFHGLSEYADEGIDWSATFGWVRNNDYSLAANIEDMNDSLIRYKNYTEEADAITNAFIGNLVSGVSSGAVTLDEVEARLVSTFSSTEGGAELVQQIMSQVKAELEGASEAAEGMGTGMESAKASAEQVNAAIGPIIAQMEALGTAYQEAYDKAYESMSGQFELFEKLDLMPDAAAAKSKEAKDEIINSANEAAQGYVDALLSQQQYIEQYKTNLEAVKEMGLSDAIIAQLSDGSTESAEILTNLVNADKGYIDQINTAFAGVEEGKSEFSDTVAEMETEFAAQMAALQAELETTVSEMDMSSDAAAAGAATVQAFADAASGKLAAVQSAFASVAETAKAALNISGSLPGHAAGTDSAERGFALVGEEGPELMWFNGGETVYNAQETQRMMSAQPANAINTSVTPAAPSLANSIIVKPEFVINGGADTTEIEAMISRATDNMKIMILDTLEEAEADRERSVYSR